MLNNILSKLVKTATLRDTVVSFSGQMSASVLGLVFFVIAFRVLGAREFGLFSLAYTTAIVIKDFVDPAINAALMRFVPGSTQTLGVIRYAATIKLGYFLVISPLLLLFSRDFSLLIFKTTVLGLVPLVLLTSTTLSFAAFLSGVFRAQKRFMLEAIYTFTQPLLRLVFTLMVVLVGLENAQTMLMVNVLGYLLTSAVALYIFTPKFITSKLPTTLIPQINKFLPPLVMSSTTGTLTDRVSLYITNYYLNLASVGTLSAITRLFTPVPQLAGALDSVLGSRFARFGNAKQANQYLYKAIGLAGLAGVGLVGSNIFIRPILGLFGDVVLDHAQVFTVLSLAYAIFLFQVPFTSKLLYFKHRPDQMAKISVIQLITTVTANITLIPRLGLVGAAWASVVVFTVSCLSTMVLERTSVSKREDTLSPN